jgi:hypothetical protein
MKYLMILFSLLSFGFAIWVDKFVVTDVQLILMVMGGCIFVGITAVLVEIAALREKER